jgi:hypothetical protein
MPRSHAPFRSALEKSVSLALQSRGIKYLYEPRSFELGNAETYTPDFWCYDIRVILEVKAVGNAQRLHKPWILARRLLRDDVPVYVWQGAGTLWSAAPSRWRADVFWVRCETCYAYCPMVPSSPRVSRCCSGPLSFRGMARADKIGGGSNELVDWRPSRDDVLASRLQ